MIRSPLGLRIDADPGRSPRDQIREAARLGAKGVVLDASGELSPDRLSESGRRDLRHTLRSVELSPIALNLPTRRPFDSHDDLDARLARADRAFAMAYELGAKLLLVRPGPVPVEADAARLEAFRHAMSELGKRADHRGVRLAIETGSEPGSVLATMLEAIQSPGLAASLDPAAMLPSGQDPIAATRALASWLVHAYAPEAGRAGRGAGHPRGFGSSGGGALEWEAYLGGLEEIGYRGFLTVWPGPGGDLAATFQAVKTQLDRF